MQKQKADAIITYSDTNVNIECIGSWQMLDFDHIARAIEAIEVTKNITWDMSHLTNVDTAGVVLYHAIAKKFNDKNFTSTIIKNNPNFDKLYNLLYDKELFHPEPPERKNILYRIGYFTHEISLKFIEFLSFFGEAFVFLLYSLTNIKLIRFNDIANHIRQAGIKALPIIAVSSFLIGVVIAYQSIVQLSKFGADIFIVDTIGISITRELAPLITAIVIAGRSGSAFTAQIGAMKITQEIDAMRTMGFDIFTFLVWPRVFALIIVMPLLIFFADIIGILGGMIIAITQSNISIHEFIHRLHDTLALKHYIIGLIKGPFFAFLIAFVGVYRGFQVSMNTESIGAYTTKSVVNAIFLVIACDAIFSIILTELKL